MTRQRIQLARPCVLYCVLLTISCVSAALTIEEMTVDAGDLGTIIGTERSTPDPDNVTHIRFAGIPYATHERFLPSVLKEEVLNTSGGPFLAENFGNNCYQFSPAEAPMGEDCLNLNVWTRKVHKEGDDPATLRPVILFVHGGGFTIGNGDFFPGDIIMNRDVVYVNFNYRIGTLGFFCLNNAEAPGNAGMYDVVTALKWVNKYIRHFGGDPTKVTLAGQSAGGAAVSLMMISPLAKGLFHRAIVASGSILNQWGHTSNAMAGSLVVAEASGCYANDSVSMPEVMACMSTLNPVSQTVFHLFVHQNTERAAGRLGLDTACPTIQNFDTGTYPKLLEDDPTKLFAEGKQENIPMMIGSTRHDGSYVMGENYKSFLIPNNLVNDTAFMKSSFVPSILRSLGIEDGSQGIYETIAKLYIGDARLTGDFQLMLPGLMDLHNVFFYHAAAHRTAILQSQINSNTFLYSFDYVGSHSMWSFLFPTGLPPFPGGIAHTDDLIYLFPLGPPYNDQDRNVSNRMMDYWANFAEFGNPTPSGSDLTIWEPIDANENQFLSFNLESHVMKNYPDAWTDVSIELFLPTTDEPTTGEPTTGEPTTGEPTTGEPTTGEPTTDEPTTTPPITTTAGADKVLMLPISLIMVFSMSYLL